MQLGDHQEDGQHHRQDDEEIADLAEGCGEPGFRPGALNQFSGLAEESIPAGAGNQRGHLSLFYDGAGIGVIPDLLGHRQRLAGKR